MKKTFDVVMADGSIQPMDFQQDGLIPIAMKRIFNKDFTKTLTDLEEEGAPAILENMDKVSELAYAMYCRGNGVDLMQADFNSYLYWLGTLDGNALLIISDDIIRLYAQGMTSASEAKKAAAQLPGA